MLREEADLNRRDIYIGELHFVHEQRRFARLTGRAVATREGWKKVREDRFPDEGHVFSVDSRFIGKRPGYVVLFTIARNDYADAKDRFVADVVCEPYEYIESLTGCDPARLRHAVVTHGLDLKQQGDGKIVVPVGIEKLAVPSVRRSPETGLWTLSPAVDVEAVDTYENELRTTELFEIGGRRFVLPGRVPRLPTGTSNWQTDPEFLQMLLRRLRRNADFGSGSEDFRVSERLAQRMFTLYRDAGAIGEPFGALTAARDRMDEFLPRLTEGYEAVALIADAVLSNDAVKKALTTLTEQDKAELRLREAERIRPEVMRAIEEEVSQRRVVRDGLDEEILQAEETLKSSSERIAEVEAALAEATEKLDGKLGSFVSDMREAGQTLTHLIGMAGAESHDGGKATRRSLAPWAQPGGSGAQVTAAELPGLLKGRAKSLGIDAQAFKLLDVHCRAGDIPTVSGGSGGTLVRGYADVVAGGRLVRQPLDPSVLGSEDLWRHPGSGLPTALAEAWSAAGKRPKETILVSLDDIDRASLSEWLPTFRSIFRASRPQNLLLLATAANGPTKDTSSPDVEAAVVAEGSETALTAALMRAGPPLKITELGVGAPLSEVPQTARSELLKQARDAGISGADAGLRLLSLYAAAAVWADEEEACRIAISCLVGAGSSARPSTDPIPLDRHIDRKART